MSNILLSSFSKSNPKLKAFLYTSFIVTIVIVSIFLMLTTLENVTNESLSERDAVQLQAIIFSIIGISIMAIIFLQWMVGILFQSLYESRSQFNINVRLIGMTKRKLMGIYLKEFYGMQLLVLPVGFLLSIGLSRIILFMIDRDVQSLGIPTLITALLLFLSITTLTVLLV